MNRVVPAGSGSASERRSGRRRRGRTNRVADLLEVDVSHVARRALERVVRTADARKRVAGRGRVNGVGHGASSSSPRGTWRGSVSDRVVRTRNWTRPAGAQSVEMRRGRAVERDSRIRRWRQRSALDARSNGARDAPDAGRSRSRGGMPRALAGAAHRGDMRLERAGCQRHAALRGASGRRGPEPDLAAHLAARSGGGVHVRVGVARAHQVKQVLEVGRRNRLPRRADHVLRRNDAFRLGPVAARRPARRRVGRHPRGRRRRRRLAQPHRDAARRERLRDVDVRLRDRALEAFVVERVLERGPVVAQARAEGARGRTRHDGDFASQPTSRPGTSDGRRRRRQREPGWPSRPGRQAPSGSFVLGSSLLAPVGGWASASRVCASIRQRRHLLHPQTALHRPIAGGTVMTV